MIVTFLPGSESNLSFSLEHTYCMQTDDIRALYLQYIGQCCEITVRMNVQTNGLRSQLLLVLCFCLALQGTHVARLLRKHEVTCLHLHDTHLTPLHNNSAVT